MTRKSIALATFTAVALVLTALAAAVAFGGPAPIAPLASINQPFANVDFSAVPRASRFQARDGTALSWHRYPAAGAATPARRVVLVHGSSARGRSMHVLAQGLAAAGFEVAALDMRGHGDSGPRGQAGYIGQLEDDVEDFMRAVPHAGPSTLLGFSSGGGFVLRFAGGSRQALFDRYVLLAPYLRFDAPTARPDNGGWASVGVARLVGLQLLNKAGIAAFNHLPVLNFGLDDEARKFLTPSYSYTLAASFGPHHDYLGDIRGARGVLHIVAGKDDELFHADRFAGVFADAEKPVTVTLVAGTNHMGLTLQDAAVRAVVQVISGAAQEPQARLP
ncbi:MAG: alpha/beta fold hydrolase [Polaromonas sp.]|uniref:alpha/beta hydrolase n=1 Tax=Polaromonas sp. TaxID=1869339 RepID=UPI001839A1E5|nr:alpha/beta fold hydrolase [Polaromonas sp.]MBA3595542.1 alpha/beta fold hydrolase [Polaromonas sp.]